MTTTVILPFKVTSKYPLDGTVDFDTDTFKAALVSDSWHLIHDRVDSTAYLRGDYYKSGTHYYRCQVAGTSDATPPSLPTDGTTITDGTAVFQDVGTSFVGGKITIPARVDSATVVVGQMYIPATANGHWYECTIAGTLAGTPPTFKTDGSTFADGTATIIDKGTIYPVFVGSDEVWADISVNEVTGTGYTAGGITMTNTALISTPTYTSFDADNLSWASSSITALWLVVYRSGTVNTLTDPVIFAALLDESMVSVGSTNSDFNITWNANGIYRLFNLSPD